MMHWSGLALFFLGTCLVVLVRAILYELRDRKRKAYCDRLDRWETEGYDVSELKRKWFAASNRNKEHVFCRNCGDALTRIEEFCSKCGVRPQTGVRFCARCGTGVYVPSEKCIRCDASFPNRMTCGKSKLASVLLAILLGYWTWLYTYRKDAWKFWLFLVVGSWALIALLVEWNSYRIDLMMVVVNLAMLSVIWASAIADAAGRSTGWYRYYPSF